MFKITKFGGVVNWEKDRKICFNELQLNALWCSNEIVGT